MARRAGKAWTSSHGWVSVKPTAERDYTDYEDACTFGSQSKVLNRSAAQLP